MVTITYTREETEVMQDVLEGYLSDLRFEIRGTDKKAFRDELKKKEHVVKCVLGQLSLIGMEEFDPLAMESAEN